MKKKLGIGLSALVLAVGLGTAGAYAASPNKDNRDSGFFDQMLPFARQMHPNLSEEQIKNRHDLCRNGHRTETSGMMMNFK